MDIGTREVVTAGVRGFGQMDRGARKLVNVETVRLPCAWKAALYMGMASLCRFGRDGSVMQRLLVENEEGLVVASVFMPIFSFETVLLGEGISCLFRACLCLSVRRGGLEEGDPGVDEAGSSWLQIPLGTHSDDGFLVACPALPDQPASRLS